MSNEKRSAPKIFDRKLLRYKRDSAAKNIDKYNFLHQKTAEEITARLYPISIYLPEILIWGAHTQKLCQNIVNRDGTEHIYWSDMSLELLQAHDLPDKCSIVVADEEYLPFGSDCLDAIVSNLTLHSINDLKGALIQARYSLKPARPFVCAVFGARTLENFKKSLMQIELQETGGVTPQIPPFVDIRVLGDLMQNLGFVDVTIDSEIVDIQYNTLDSAIADIRGMGEGNILHQRSKQLIKKSFLRGLGKHFQQNDINLSIEILYVMAWSSK